MKIQKKVYTYKLHFILKVKMWNMTNYNKNHIFYLNINYVTSKSKIIFYTILKNNN